MSGWCGRGDRPRKFTKRPTILFCDPSFKHYHYDTLRFSALMGRTVSTEIATKEKPILVSVKKNTLCRLSLPDGPQIGHVFLWNANNNKEYISIGTTQILQGTHMTKYARLWSREPYVQPMATVVADSIPYNEDEDGARLHDVIGSVCAENTYRLLTGKVNETKSCKESIAFLIKENECEGPHHGWNIFNCSGFLKETNQYFTKATPSIKGDYIDFIADMDLKVGLVSCSRGNGFLDAERNIPTILQASLKCEVFEATEV